jgi:DNA-3-methyladenine glycosylase II
MLQASQPHASRLISFNQPFDWQRMLDFFAARMTAGVEAVVGGVYLRNIEFKGSQGALTVELAPDGQQLLATAHGEVSQYINELIVPVSHMFDLYAEPHIIDQSLAQDPWLASLVQRRPGLRVPGAFSGFELAVRTIVGQQVSVKGATTIVGRLVQRAGVQVNEGRHPQLAWRFPTPEALAQANLDKIGMPGKRVDTCSVSRQRWPVASCPLTFAMATSAMCGDSCWPCPASAPGPWSTLPCAPGVTRTPGPPPTWC